MTVTLRFLADLPLYREEKPYKLLNFSEISPDLKTNCQYVEQHGVTLTNVRESERDYSVDDCGFQILNHEFKSAPSRSQFADPSQRDHLVREYLSEVVALVKEELCAQKVFCFDWRIRSNVPQSQSLDVPLDDISNARSYVLTPAVAAHCDYSYESGLERVQSHVSEEEKQEISSGEWRVRIMNLWRPIIPVHNAPLVFCDRRSVSLEDYIAVDDVTPDRVEEELYLKDGCLGDWYWLEEQLPSESVLFVLWDSDRQGLGSYYTPHGSGTLDDQSTGISAPRESVEVRLVVMHRISEPLQ